MPRSGMGVSVSQLEFAKLRSNKTQTHVDQNRGPHFGVFPPFRRRVSLSLSDQMTDVHTASYHRQRYRELGQMFQQGLAQLDLADLRQLLATHVHYFCHQLAAVLVHLSIN